LPRVAAAWKERNGRPFTDSDVDRLHELFLPMTLAAVAQRAALVPGALQVVNDLRGRGLKIGSTTGYDRATMEALLPLAAAQGYAPDCVVTATDLPLGRPSPLMMYQCFIELQVWPASAVVKVDDTAPGVAEGVSAGAWTIGVSTTGSTFGFSAEDAAAMPAEEFATRRRAAEDELADAGAHYVIDSVRELPAVLELIERRLAAGERP
jgi:phosphonoacetaldehyde hydrolase